MLPCGSSTCNTSTDYCCVENADAGGTRTCVAPNGSCSPPATRIGCKEAADCAGGAVCCANFPSLGVQGATSCLASCTGTQNVQICRTDDECGAKSDAGELKKCVLQTCGSLTLQLCAVSPGGGPGGPKPDGGGAYLLTRLVGPLKAKELVFFGDDLSAPDAARLGLVNRVVAGPALRETAGEWAGRLAAGPTPAIALSKRLINRVLEIDRVTAFADERWAQEIAMASGDAAEGLASFAERRAPVFRGW